MYYNNIYFHNVNLMKKDEDGNYLLSRFDDDVLFQKSSGKNKNKVTVSNKETIPNFEENANNENEALEVNDAEQADVLEPAENAEPEAIEEVQDETESEEIQEENEAEEVEQTEEDTLKESVLEPYKTFNNLSLGTELRFKLVSDTVSIKLKLLNGQSPAQVEVYFGNYFAGKDYSLIIKDDEVLEYVFEKSLIPAVPKKVSKKDAKKANKGFANNVVRILLPTRNVLFVGVEGLTEIPQEYEMPSKNIVFLGSNGLAASEIDKPSLSIAFETATKLKVDYYNLSAEINKKSFKKLLPYVTKLGKNSIIICDLITCEIGDKNYRLQLRLLKRKLKLLSKFKNRVLFITYLFNYFNFKRVKRENKVRRKIAKMLRKKNYINPYASYSECMTSKIYELTAFAVGKITIDLTENISENYLKFVKKPVKVANKYVYYSIKSAADEPTKNPIVMTSAEKRAYLKAQKLALKEKRKNKKQR